jgi:hypothetical protein
MKTGKFEQVENGGLPLNLGDRPKPASHDRLKTGQSE